MGTEQPHTFGETLKHYRLAAGLTHEALAERARLSVRGLSDLEHGRTRTPRHDTLALLRPPRDGPGPLGAGARAAPHRGTRT